MRFAVVAIVVAWSASTYAQPGLAAPGVPPGMSPPAVPGGPPGMSPPAAPGVPPPYAYQPPPTPEEQELLEQGEITPAQTVAGGMTAVLIGFGVGQGVEGRWHERGWIFTVGDTVSSAAMLGGFIALLSCVPINDSDQQCSSPAGAALFVTGAIALAGFRIWEIADAFAGPSGHNARVHELRRRYGVRDGFARITPYIARPHGTDGGMTAGLTLRF